jgi:diguanylate cyclase (GGDEF)-like protein/PAS domain S-box-containing protein
MTQVMAFIAPAMTSLAALGVLTGVRVHNPPARRPWWLVFAALVMCAVAGWSRIAALKPLYFLGEFVLVAALVVVLRVRHARIARATAIDASIITLAFAAITWLYLIGPYATAASATGLARAWAPIASTADVALVAVGSLLMLGALRAGRSALLLGGAIVALVASHLVFVWASLHGGHGVFGPDTVAWITFCVLLAGAALHPSMRRFSGPAERSDGGLTRARLAVFAFTSLLAPAVTIAQAVLHEPSHVVISIASGVIFLLVLLRIGDLVGEHQALTESNLRSQFEARLGSLVRNSSDVVSIVDADGVVQYISPAALRLLGLEESEAQGMDWWEFVHPDDQPALQWFLAELQQGASGDVEYRVRDAERTWVHVETLATNLVGDGAVEGIVLNTRDVSERKALERRLMHQASHDALTGLPNRMLLRDRVEQALARRRRSGTPIAVIFLDHDDFKNVNDTLGHAAGDAVLQEVARRLDGCIRACDTATRLGGDEFAVLVDDLTDESQAVAVAQRILAALARPMEIAGRPVQASGSLGIAFAVDGRDSADDLLRDADAAMYLAKDRGKGLYAIYEPAMHAAAVARLELKVDLARAIADGEITLVYQPVVALANGAIRDFEALARWTHPTRGNVPPAEFIALAEQTGLIVPLGRDLLRQACRQAAAFHKACTIGEPLRVSVNVSARQLVADDFVDHVREAVDAAGIRPCDLILELTESAIMTDLELAVARMTELRELGVGLAVDDFGTGYSSLNSLRALPADRLKIDRSFIAGLGDSRTRALTEMIVELGGLLEMLVVAEGIETDEQMAGAVALGCVFAQGFGLQRPIPAEDVLTHLAEHGRWVPVSAAA